MIVLGIETCTPAGGVALVDGPRLLGVERTTDSKAHSREILPAAMRLLEGAGLRWEDLDAVAASAGPGSFTGVRVGLSIAKALCLAGAPRLVLVSSLEALAFHARPAADGACVAAAFNARMGDVYFALFDAEGGRLLDDAAADPETAARAIAGALPDGASCVLAGDGAPLLEPLLAPHPGARSRPAPPDRALPDPAATAWLGAAAAARGAFADPASAAPVYLRDANVSKPRPRTTLAPPAAGSG